jgi:hypothetical protein
MRALVQSIEPETHSLLFHGKTLRKFLSSAAGKDSLKSDSCFFDQYFLHGVHIIFIGKLLKNMSPK